MCMNTSGQDGAIVHKYIHKHLHMTHTHLLVSTLQYKKFSLSRIQSDTARCCNMLQHSTLKVVNTIKDMSRLLPQLTPLGTSYSCIAPQTAPHVTIHVTIATIPVRTHPHRRPRTHTYAHMHELTPVCVHVCTHTHRHMLTLITHTHVPRQQQRLRGCKRKQQQPLKLLWRQRLTGRRRSVLLLWQRERKKSVPLRQ